MKYYKVKGVYNDTAVDTATVIDGDLDIVEIELRLVNKEAIVLKFHNEADYRSLLFHKRDGTTARKYLKQLHLKVVEAVI